MADTILVRSKDPAADGLRIKDSPASYLNLVRTLLSRPDLYGYYGRDSQRQGR